MKFFYKHLDYFSRMIIILKSYLFDVVILCSFFNIVEIKEAR